MPTPLTPYNPTFTAWELRAAKLQGLARYDQKKADEELVHAKRHLELARQYHQMSIEELAEAGTMIKEHTNEHEVHLPPV
jgi:hypothetical protein